MSKRRAGVVRSQPTTVRIFVVLPIKFAKTFGHFCHGIEARNSSCFAVAVISPNLPTAHQEVPYCSSKPNAAENRHSEPCSKITHSIVVSSRHHVFLFLFWGTVEFARSSYIRFLQRSSILSYTVKPLGSRTKLQLAKHLRLPVIKARSCSSSVSSIEWSDFASLTADERRSFSARPIYSSAFVHNCDQ